MDWVQMKLEVKRGEYSCNECFHPIPPENRAAVLLPTLSGARVYCCFVCALKSIFTQAKKD